MWSRDHLSLTAQSLDKNQLITDESLIITVLRGHSRVLQEKTRMDLTSLVTQHITKHVSNSLYISLSTGQQRWSVIWRAASNYLIMLYSFLCYKRLELSVAFLSPIWPCCFWCRLIYWKPPVGRGLRPSQRWMRGRSGLSLSAAAVQVNFKERACDVSSWGDGFKLLHHGRHQFKHFWPQLCLLALQCAVFS